MTTWLHERISPAGALWPLLELPRRYATASVKEIQRPGLAACVRKYGTEFWDVAPKGIGPLFVGTAGTGKTYAATVIARAVHDVMRIPVVWCNCAEELVRFDREAFSPDVQKRIHQLKTTEFVVLDDFAQFKDGRQLDTLGEIISARYNNQLPTLFTGNITIAKNDYAELEKAVGAMIARRVVEMTEGFKVMVRKEGA